MKLLVQSDDYGMTPAVADGIIYGIKHGIVRNTGLFSNMPWASECVDKIRPYLEDIAFGIDLNASTGPSILGYERVPNLCHKDGSFLTSTENRTADIDAPNHDHVNFDQLFLEFDAQVQRFIELVGKKPDYIHDHAYGTETTEKVRREIAKKYNRPYSEATAMLLMGKHAPMGWYKYHVSPEEQLAEDPISYITEDKGGLLGNEYGCLITHCGYVDAQLMSLSSFNLCRIKDLEACCSAKMRDWISKNNIELITYKDLDQKHRAF